MIGQRQRFEAWRCAVDRFPDTLLGSDEKEFFFDAVLWNKTSAETFPKHF